MTDGILADGADILAAVAAKADALRDALAAKVDRNLSGDVLHARSGALRASISSAITAGDDAVAITIESTGVAYAAIQEYGGRTAAHDIVAVKARALHLADGGFARSVHHPGSTIPSRSYLRSALEDLRSELEDGVKAAVLEALGVT